MREFQFEKNGLIFMFKDPKIKGEFQGGTLTYRYKIQEISEPKSNDNDEFFHEATFISSYNGFEIYLDGKRTIITLPHDLKEAIQKFYHDEKERYNQELINQDFKYRLHDNTSYGIYNGVSEHDIQRLVWRITDIFGIKTYMASKESIVKHLNNIDYIK